jgi:meso-butanediol dehydrogenase/(S,S)-butanediol dehydrogenase/diacetyl reductase
MQSSIMPGYFLQMVYFIIKISEERMGKLSGCGAIITGATSGIGKATALLFAREGADLIITGRRQPLGQQVADEIQRAGGQCFYIQADHTLPGDCERSVEESIKRFGRLDILFNNAGIVTQGSAETTSEEEWAETMAINVTAVWRMSSLAIPHMRKNGKGAIVNNGSDLSVVGAKGFLPYATSKGAVALMTKSMALDLAAENIRVNAVCPGDTFVERWLERGFYEHGLPVTPEEAMRRSAADLPMGRYAQADEVAKAVLFLACDDSSFITGHTLMVDGGKTAA